MAGYDSLRNGGKQVCRVLARVGSWVRLGLERKLVSRVGRGEGVGASGMDYREVFMRRYGVMLGSLLSFFIGIVFSLKSCLLLSMETASVCDLRLSSNGLTKLSDSLFLLYSNFSLSYLFY
jgi:hypothetical protein